MSYGTAYIDIPKLYRSSGGKGNKMPNNKTTQTVEQSKPAKKYAKTRGEHYKDIVIAVLIVGILAFIGGMHFANQHNADVSKAVASVQTVAPAKK